MEIFKLFGSIMVDNSKANESISKTDKNAKGLMGSIGGGIKAAAKLGTAVVAAAGTAAVALGVVATKAAMEFESQLANVGTLLDGDIKKRLGELGENVKKLSIDTGVSTDLLTDGLYQVVSAFGDTADASKILEVAAKSAKAGNATVTDSVNLLSAVTKGYGDTSAEAAQKASDLAFLTVKLGQTSFPELASSMGKVIPLASTMKVKQEELFGAMATLTGVTGNTAEVSTQLRATIQGMLQPTSKMASSIKSLGYENGQAMIESLGFKGTLDKLKESVGGNEIAFSDLFGSIEAKNAVLALTGAQAETFTEKLDAMSNASGATEAAFEQQMDSFKARWGKITNHVKVMGITVGEKFLPALNSVAKWVESKMPLVEEALNTMLGFIDTIAAGFQAVRQEFEDTGEPIEYIYTLFKEIFGVELPKEFLWFIEEIIIGWQTLWTIIKEFWDGFVVPLFDQVKENFSVVKDHADEIFNALSLVFKTMFEVMKGAWDNIGKPIFDMILSLVGTISDFFAERMPAITEFFSQMATDISILWQEHLQPCFQAIGDFINNVLAPAFEWVFNNVIGPIIDGCFKGIIDLWNNSLKPIFQNIIDFITNVFTGNWKGAWDNVIGILKGIWDGAVAIIKVPFNAIIGMVNKLIDGINSFEVPDWIPFIGGASASIPQIPMLYKGTDYFEGGVAMVGEQGPELVEMPRGAKVNTADETRKILGNNNNTNDKKCIIQFVTDSKMWAEATVNASDLLNGTRINLTERGLII
ncbi:MAG: phage tail tape measure protein [Clostridium sp.]